MSVSEFLHEWSYLFIDFQTDEITDLLSCITGIMMPKKDMDNTKIIIGSLTLDSTHTQ